MKRLPLALLLSTTAFATAAEAGPAYTQGVVNLRAGPSSEYPLVAPIPPNTRLDVNGCLDDFTWCDVDWEGNRGWVYGDYLFYDYQNQRVPVLSVGAALGIGIVAFSIGDYWGRYYTGRPWYRRESYWMHRPPPPRHPPHRPGFGPGGGHRPGFGPGPGRPPGHGGPGAGRPPGHGGPPGAGRPPGQGRPPGGGRPPGNGRPPNAGRPPGGGQTPGAGKPPAGGRPGAGSPPNGGSRPPGGGRPGGNTRPSPGGGGARPGGRPPGQGGGGPGRGDRPGNGGPPR